MKAVWVSIRYKLVMLVLLGLLYPLILTLVAQFIFSKEAGGSFIYDHGRSVGSEWMGQKFEKNNYFWSRPSTSDYNPLASGGSNLGSNSSDLKKVFEERRQKLKRAHPDDTQDPPQDLIFASASGLDPHISIEGALYQLKRVAKARNMSEEKVRSLIDKATEPRSFGIFGESRVHVLKLNLMLDQSS